VASHGALAKAALERGAHVFVEKPMTATGEQSRELLALAERLGRRVFVDHTFLFTGAVQELKKQVRSGAIGELLYVDSVRINLGLFQPDVDVVWDLAPHDLSILHHVIGQVPKSVRAMGSSHSPSGLADVAYLHLDYERALTAHLHLSWLSPVKVRRMIFAGGKQSLIYDDLEAAEKVKIYDHGVDFDVKDLEERRRILVSYRKGDMRAPNIPANEALAVELHNVAQVLRGEATAQAPGADGAAVVRVLEAAQRSLAQGGKLVAVEGA
jgi:predicted dehydrogenase